MEWLKKLLGDELYKQVEPKLGDKKILLQEKEGDWIPKARFDEVNTKKTDLEKENKTLSTELAASKKKATDLEAEKGKGDKTVEERLEKLENEKNELVEKIKKGEDDLKLERKKSVLRAHLSKEEADLDYFDTLTKDFDFENLEIENDKIKGWENLVKPVKEKHSKLFGENFITGNPPEKKKENEEPIKEVSSEDYYKSVLNPEKK